MRMLALLLAAACAHRVEGPAVRAEESAVFTGYTPLASNAELARRGLTPLTVLHAQQALAKNGLSMRDQPIELENERFSVYVPPGPPPKEGYGLLVFIAPWDEPTMPLLWRSALEKHHMAFVCAARSGNDEKVFDRRVPLALLGWHNMRLQYAIDPRRTYVGGLSGGSRAAEMTALAYPDIFAGVLLNAGSDPIGGEAGMFLPPRDLFEKLQRMRLVYVTGDEDDLNLHDDMVSRDSMREWCVFDVEVKTVRHLGHQMLDPTSFDRALDLLDQRANADEGELAKCNARIEQELAQKLAGAEAALRRGDLAGARQAASAIDRRYANLAKDALIALDAKLSR